MVMVGDYLKNKLENVNDSSKNKNINKFLLVLFLILFIVAIGVSVTYAFYRVQFDGNKIIHTEIPGVKVVYTEPDSPADFKFKASEGAPSEYFEFSVSATTAQVIDLNYHIYLTKEADSVLTDDKVNIQLSSFNDNVETIVVSEKKLSDCLNFDIGENSKLIYDNTFNFISKQNTTITHVYRFRAWSGDTTPGGSGSSPIVTGGDNGHTNIKTSGGDLFKFKINVSSDLDDNNAPVISASTNNFDITFTITDNVGVTGYAVTNSTAVPNSWTNVSSTKSLTKTITKSSYGTYYIHAKDINGNKSYVAVEVKDNIPPTIKLFATGDDGLEVNFTITDNDKVVGFAITDTPSAPAASEWLERSPIDKISMSKRVEQRKTYYFHAKDKNGNTNYVPMYFNGLDYASDTLGYKLLGANKANVKEAEQNFTGTSASNSQSGIFRSIETLNGFPTFYLKGNINNNYVKFGKNETGDDLIWRVVRVNEDGTIRMILNSTIGDGAFGNDSLNIYDPFYNNSSAKTVVEQWFNKTNFVNNVHLVEGKYCEEFKAIDAQYIDMSLMDQGFDPFMDYFDVSTLLDDYVSNFYCNSNRVLNLKVGLLSMDEAIRAGVNNSNYYLLDYNGFWLMNPGALVNNHPEMGEIGTMGFWVAGQPGSNGGLAAFNVSSYHSFRPVINLDANVTVTGTGSSSSPYVVQ